MILESTGAISEEEGWLFGPVVVKTFGSGSIRGYRYFCERRPGNLDSDLLLLGMVLSWGAGFIVF